MACFLCDGGFWVCDPEQPDPCSFAMATDVSWRFVGRKQVDAGVHTVWCKLGCSDVEIQDAAPGSQPPWVNTGSMPFKDAEYDVYCAPGGHNGTKCQVRLQEVP